MTEYKDYDGKLFDKVTSENVWRYLELAREDYLKPSLNLLPCDATSGDIILIAITEKERYTPQELKANIEIFQETLKKTFETSDPDTINNLIYTFGTRSKEYETSSTYKTATEIVKNSVEAILVENHSWLDKLDTKAKLTIARLKYENHLSLDNAKNYSFSNFAFPKEKLPFERPNICKAAELYLDCTSENSWKEEGWRTKVAALNTIIDLGWDKGRFYLAENFVKLVETAKNADDVRLLTETVEKLGKQLVHGSDNNNPKLQFKYWSQLIPETKETQKFFYTYLQVTDPKLLSFEKENFNWSNPNEKFYKEALNETRADLELAKLRSGTDFSMETILKYGFNKLSIKKDFNKLNVEKQKKFLDYCYQKVEPQKYLQMATIILNNNETVISPIQFADILNKAKKLKPLTSKEMENFCSAAQNLTQKLEEQARKHRNYIQECNELQASRNQTAQNAKTYKNMATLMNNLREAFSEIERYKGEKDFGYGIDKIETFIGKAISAPEGTNFQTKLQFEPLGKLNRIFSNKKTLQDHENLGQAVEKFNQVLDDCRKHPEFRDYSGRMLKGNAINDLLNRSYEANEQTKKLDNQIALYYEFDEKSAFIKDYKNYNFDEAVNNLSQSISVAREELKEKAKLGLAMGFQGMETDKPMLEEHEERATETYAISAKKIEDKLKSLHKKDLEERGILDPSSPNGRPGDHTASQSGQPIRKDTKEKINQIIQTKKTYEKLSKR